MNNQPKDAPLTEQELNELGWCGDTAQRPMLPDERQRAENIVTRLMPRVVAELRELRGIVDNLPKTADGVPLVGGMVLWRGSRAVALGYEPENPAEWYSTRDAAEAAKEAK